MLLITSVIANVVLVGATAAALQRANCKDKDESGLAWDAEVMQLYKSGQYEECPAETTWWTHHANVGRPRTIFLCFSSRRRHDARRRPKILGAASIRWRGASTTSSPPGIPRTGRSCRAA